MKDRYQVRAPDSETYSRVANLLRGAASVVLALPRRRTLSVEDLGPQLQQQVRAMGATVEREYQYTAEPSAS